MRNHVQVDMFKDKRGLNVWLQLHRNYGGVSTVITRHQAEQLRDKLTVILKH